MRRTTGKIAKIESKKRWLDSLRDFVRGDADINPIRIQPVRASAQPVLERTARRAEQNESAWQRDRACKGGDTWHGQTPRRVSTDEALMVKTANAHSRHEEHP